MAAIIGTPMTAKVAQVFGDAPGEKFNEMDRRWKQEVQDRLEAPVGLLADAIATEGDMTFSPTGSAVFMIPAGHTFQVYVAGAIMASIHGAGMGLLGALTATGVVTGSALTTAGAVSGATVAATGAVTGASVAATGDVAGASVTTAQADIKHGDKVVMLGVEIGALGAGATWSSNHDTQGYATSTSAVANDDGVAIPLALAVGDRIKSVKMYGRSGGTNSDWQLKVWKHAMGSSTWTQLGSTQATVNAGVAIDDNLSVTGLTETVVAGTRYYATWATTGAGGAQRRCYGAELTFDRV